eukprot:1140092-Rhodomonas_salina.1
MRSQISGTYSRSGAPRRRTRSRMLSSTLQPRGTIAIDARSRCFAPDARGCCVSSSRSRASSALGACSCRDADACAVARSLLPLASLLSRNSGLSTITGTELYLKSEVHPSFPPRYHPLSVSCARRLLCVQLQRAIACPRFQTPFGRTSCAEPASMSAVQAVHRELQRARRAECADAGPIHLRARYAMSGTDVGYADTGLIHLRARYAMSGTDVGYADSAYGSLAKFHTDIDHAAAACGLAMPCPLPEAQKKKGVIAASAGNHALGLSLPLALLLSLAPCSYSSLTKPFGCCDTQLCKVSLRSKAGDSRTA